MAELIGPTIVKKKSKGHRCYFCGKKFLEVKSLKRHITDHLDRDFTCDFCEQAFTDKPTCKRHIREIHLGPTNTHMCERCGKMFKRRYDLFKHQEKITNCSKYRSCASCSNTIPFGKQSRFCKKCRARGIQITADGLLKCPTCNLKFEGIRNLESHWSEEGTICHVANQAAVLTKPVYKARKEMVKKIKKPTHECKICPAKFPDQRSLNTHVRSHPEFRPYYCKHCTDTFRTALELRNHMFKHSSFRPYRCELCGEHFRTKNMLDRHFSRYHSDDHPYVCEVCDNAYKSVLSLRRHERVHYPNAEGTYKCGLCMKTFSSSYCLSEHLIIHGAREPHTCNICGKQFKFYSNLYRHKLRHSNKKQYACVLCPKSFSVLTTLNMHLFTVHSGEHKLVDIKCQECGEIQKDAKTFRQHMITKHLKESFSIPKPKTIVASK